MINLKDLTFTIPIRIDTPERSRNLVTTIKYINKHFDTNIMVYEESLSPVVDKLLSDNNITNVKYKHIQTTSSLFRRTHLLNLMAVECTTPYIANYDADILLKLSQYEYAMELLRSGQSEMIYPYNGRFINLIDETLEKVVAQLDVENIQESDGHLIHPNSLGGVIIWKKSKFMQIGMENENFVSWGWEDNARLSVAMKLGVKISRVDGCLFHMHHPVSENSSNTKHQAYMDNQREFLKVNNMSPTELLKYIGSWSWMQ
jgi:hypothetical protein